MAENWIKWEPVQGLAERYSLDLVIDTKKEGFRIEFSAFEDRKKKIYVNFPNWVHAYRYGEEIFALDRIDQLTKKYGKGFLNWTFFKVADSSYLQWLSHESHTISDDRKLQHFAFILMDSILDVVAPYEPAVQFVEEK